MKRIWRVLVSTLPLLVIVLLSPIAWALIFSLDDERWRVIWTTIWIFGGIEVGAWYHAKVLDDEMNKK